MPAEVEDLEATGAAGDKTHVANGFACIVLRVSHTANELLLIQCSAYRTFAVQCRFNTADATAALNRNLDP